MAEEQILLDTLREVSMTSESRSVSSPSALSRPGWRSSSLRALLQKVLFLKV